MVPKVGVEIAVATAVVTVVGVKCCVGSGFNAGRGVGGRVEIGVGVGMSALYVKATDELSAGCCPPTVATIL